MTLKTLGNGKKNQQGIEPPWIEKLWNLPILRNLSSDSNNIFPEPLDCACRVRVWIFSSSKWREFLILVASQSCRFPKKYPNLLLGGQWEFLKFFAKVECIISFRGLLLMPTPQQKFPQTAGQELTLLYKSKTGNILDEKALQAAFFLTVFWKPPKTHMLRWRVKGD